MKLHFNTTRSFAPLLLAIGLLAFLGITKLSAQNVTISPTTGKLIAGFTKQNEIGFQSGASSLWRHEQLPLSLLLSDEPELTVGQQLKVPAGNIRYDEQQKLYIIEGGRPITTSTHLNISLPKGYRFTGYRMVFLNNYNNKTYASVEHVAQNKTIYETDGTFNTDAPKTTPLTLGSSNSTQEFVIERTSANETDMGNNLYFIIKHDKDKLFGVTLKSCELFFTAEGAFTSSVSPTSPADIVSQGVNVIGAPFATSRIDLGQIKPHTKDGNTYYSYNYMDVKDLNAANMFYQEDAVTADHKLPATPSNGSIQVLQNEGKMYYAVGNNTYYVETPTAATTQNGNTIPLGYRITKAKINYHYGVAVEESSINYTGNLDGYYITSVYNNRTYYLQTNGKWSNSNKVLWKIGETGKISSGGNYLKLQSPGFFSNNYNVTSTTNANNASIFAVTNGQVTYKVGSDNTSYVYLALTSTNGNAQMVSSSDDAASWAQATGEKTITNPSFTPSAYTLTVYGTNKSEPYQTVQVTDGKDGAIELTDLNNDAIKFTVSGLAENTQALITVELTLEALNPFINTIDIVCHSMIENGPELMQQFTSNDFQVSGGKFLFYVPQEFFGGGAQKCRFTFENLYSKYGDATYGLDDPHHARYFFVKSDYYNTYNGKQYNTTGHEPADTKIATSTCGDKAFKYSNIDELNNDNTSGTTALLEEYPYSETRYTEQGGTFTDNIVIDVNGEKKCYLFTADETQWNVAPTTALEHRNYAYYLMDLRLETKDYKGKCELKKIYENTCYDIDGTDTNKAMYGGVFKAVDSETNEELPNESAYLTVNMMRTALTEALHKEGADVTGKQVLYLDYTNLYSVYMPKKDAINEMKALLNPNCLLYFPTRTSCNEDNFVQKTKSGSYRACKNIVITDKQPFFAPYKITVPAENYATYSRQITRPINGKVTLATVMLPFALNLEDGVHTNATADACSFSLSQMAPTNCLALDENEVNTPHDYYAKAHFTLLTSDKTLPNVPYMVNIINAPTNDDVSFIATQYGADIAATTSMNTTDYTFEGETATGTIANTNYTFTNRASYSGKMFNAREANVFYFAKNNYLYCRNLRPGLDNLYAYPFRGYYECNSQTYGAKLNKFSISFDDAGGWTTGITNVDTRPDLAIYAGEGTITAKAQVKTVVKVYAVNGMIIATMNIEQGETKSISLPAGIYVVNNVKIIVR